MNRILAHILLVTGLLISANASSRELPRAHPRDADREMMQMEETVFFLEIEAGESFDLDARGVRRVTIDETALLDATTAEDGKRLVFNAKKSGKAVIRLHTKSGATTIIVKISA